MQLPAKQTASAVEIPDDLKELFNPQDNMEGVIPRLPQIKIIHAGGLFQMPDETKPESFECVIIDKHAAAAWWEKDKEETGVTAPDCFSMNGIYPEQSSANQQSEKCLGCPQNEFGTALKGKGKACKTMRRVHLIMENSVLPRRLTVGPTSLQSFDDYMTTLVDRGLKFCTAVTRFSLETKEADCNVWSIIKCEFVRKIENEEVRPIANYMITYKDGARTQEIKSDEYYEEDTSFKTEEMESDIPY